MTILATQASATSPVIPVENTPKGAEAAKAEKVPNLLVLPNADKLGEEVISLISDARGEKDLLAQSLTKRASKTTHATGMLQTIGAIVDGTWQGLPKWTNGKEATFADIAKQIVPNPANYAYTGAKGRTDKPLESGELLYSEDVDMVATALRDAARKAGRKADTSRPTAKTGESDKPGNTPEAVLVATDQDMTVQFGQITSFLTSLVEMGESVKVDATAQIALLDACRAYVASCAPVATPAKRTSRAR